MNSHAPMVGTSANLFLGLQARLNLKVVFLNLRNFSNKFAKEGGLNRFSSSLPSFI